MEYDVPVFTDLSFYFSIFSTLQLNILKGPSSQGYGFSSGHVWMWELDCEESWALKNWCFWTVVLEKTLESPLDCKKIQPVHPKGDQSWVFIGRTMPKLKLQYFGHLMQTVDSLEKTLMLGLGAGGEGDDREWDGWMASLTRWTWVWVNSWSWWWTGRPGVLRFMGSQRVRHDWVTELNWRRKMSKRKINYFFKAWVTRWFFEMKKLWDGGNLNAYY